MDLPPACAMCHDLGRPAHGSILKVRGLLSLSNLDDQIGDVILLLKALEVSCQEFGASCAACAEL